MSNCIDGLDNCDQVISDKCVLYTGVSNSQFGLCSGSTTLFEFETIVINALTSLSNANNTLPVSTNPGSSTTPVILGCTYTTTLLGTNPSTLVNLLNALFAGECDLNTRVVSIQTQINPTYSFNLACLSGLPTNPGIADILQANILQTCAATTGLAAIQADYVKASELCTLVEECLANTPPVLQYGSMMVPYAPIPYIGPLSNFDNTGKGITAAGFTNVYMMNGLNGTQDWRGRSPIGAVANIPGGTLDSAVDPTLSQNAGTNYAVGDKAGMSFNALTVNQLPAHTHGVNDPGHIHTGPKPVLSVLAAVSANAYVSNGESTTNTFATASAYTGITIATVGSGIPIDNRHPVVACVYIVYIP